jgi:hypothetical protein
LSPGEPDGDNGWYASDVTLSLSASDGEGSGMAKTEYRLNEGDWIPYTGSIPAFGDGIYKVDYRSTDAVGHTEEIQSVEFKIDKTAPSLTVELDITSIWPPTGKMVTVHAALYSADDGSGVASVILTSIASNEPDGGEDDIQADIGSAATSFGLRAKRSGGGTGRVYAVTYTATDNAGNRTPVSVTVAVPHDRSGDK